MIQRSTTRPSSSKRRNVIASQVSTLPVGGTPLIVPSCVPV